MNKKTYTLGLCNAETSSACLFINNSLVSAVSEERFTRKKYDNSFPQKSINYVLKENKIKLNRIDNICYSWSKGLRSDVKKLYEKRLLYLKKKNIKEYRIFLQRYETEILRDKKNKKEFENWTIKSLTKKQLNNVNIFYHHESHAANASLLSPFNKGLVVTADGRGDFESFTISTFDRKKKNPLKKIYFATTSDSFGYYYGRITGLLGFKPMQHEGKITGLSSHGDHKKAMSLMKKMISIKNGEIVASLGDLYKPFFKPYSRKLIKKIKKFSREDVAAAAQKHLENCICKIITYYAKKLKLKSTSLMLSGGVFANVKLNNCLKSLKFVNRIFVQPHMGDGGLCLGAAALQLHKKNISILPMKNVYLGPRINIKNIKKLKKEFPKIKVIKCKSVKNEMCKDLKKNKVLGFLRGKMEFGPRALCNRSIFYKTSDKTINDWLNKRMKRTEFMPFAPVIRNEVANVAFEKYHSNDPTFSFMTSTVKCKNKFKKVCPAVTHIDQTARPQVIYKNTDPFMWKLLKKWEKETGEMSLVNTSFNAHEEPIICYEKDAIKSLQKKMIDVLYVEKFKIIIKNFKRKTDYLHT